MKPAGINARLLGLAAMGGPLRGLTSDVVLLEFFRHATGGTLGQVFEPDDVWDYVRAHEPLLEVEQASIGRHLPERTDLHNLPLNEIVYHLTGKRRKDLLAELEESPTLADRWRSWPADSSGAPCRHPFKGKVKGRRRPRIGRFSRADLG